MARQPPVGQGFLIFKILQSHLDTHNSVEFLLISDQPVTETSTWQHAKLTRDRHPHPRRNSNPQSQQRVSTDL